MKKLQHEAYQMTIPGRARRIVRILNHLDYHKEPTIEQYEAFYNRGWEDIKRYRGIGWGTYSKLAIALGKDHPGDPHEARFEKWFHENRDSHETKEELAKAAYNFGRKYFKV